MADTDYLYDYWKRIYTARLIESLNHEYYTTDPEYIRDLIDCIWQSLTTIISDHYLVKRIKLNYQNLQYPNSYSSFELLELLTMEGWNIEEENYKEFIYLPLVDELLWQEVMISKIFKFNEGYNKNYYIGLSKEMIREHLKEILKRLPLYETKLYMRTYYCESLEEITKLINKRIGATAAAWFYQETSINTIPKISYNRDIYSYIKERFDLGKEDLSKCNKDDWWEPIHDSIRLNQCEDQLIYDLIFNSWKIKFGNIKEGNWEYLISNSYLKKNHI